jgi:AmmeMemoRadiSam system protein B
VDRPRLRPLESFPVRQGREVRLGLRDPEGLADGVLVASPALALLMSFLDGTRDADGIARDWREATGADLDPADLARALAELDRGFLLEGPRAEARRAGRLARFRALPSRPAAHADASYPADAPSCAAALEGHVAAAGDVALPAETAGLLAPHVDLRGGGPCHGAAARALERSPATTFVVVGTAHAPLRRPFALTTHDFETPLGPVPTDRDLVERLARRGGGRLLDDELAHATEHSVEFQALWLRDRFRGRDVRVVPLLARSLAAHVRDGTSPRDDPEVSDFVDALRETLDERGRDVAVVGSIDLAHVGPRYGDDVAPDSRALARVRAADEDLLRAATALDGEAWIRSLSPHGDAYHVCGTAPAYVVLETLRGRGLAGTVLRHDAWEIDPDTGSHVSFAAVAFGPR